MGRILFLSAVAFLAYRYISKSNERHQALPPGKGDVEILPPPVTGASDIRESATEALPSSRELATASTAAEPEPHR